MTILLLHGALGATTQLEPLKKNLENKGATVHMFNFSSHGGEPASPKGFGVPVFAEEVLHFLDKNNLKSVHIFGYSMGGYVALWLAHHHPTRITRIATLGTKFDWSPEAAEKETKKLVPEKILEKIPAFGKVLEERHLPGDWKELMKTTAGMMTELGKGPLLTPAILKSINTPTLVMLGDTDDMVDRAYSSEVAGLLPQGTFKLLAETPHLIEKTNLTMLADQLSPFFN